MLKSAGRIIGLLFSGLIKRLLGAFRWIVTNPLAAALIIALVASVWLWRANTGLRDDLRDEQAGHAATRADFGLYKDEVAQAAKEAERQAIERVKRVEKERERINEAAKLAYSRDVADWRARFERLRSRQDRSAVGNLPAPVQASAGTDGADSDSTGPATVTVRVDHLQQVVEGALRGRALQDAIGAQEGVE